MDQIQKDQIDLNQIQKDRLRADAEQSATGTNSEVPNIVEPDVA